MQHIVGRNFIQKIKTLSSRDWAFIWIRLLVSIIDKG